MSHPTILWTIISLITLFAQVILDTDLGFALISLLIFLILPQVYLQFERVNSFGGYLVVATFAKLFIVSQWLKIIFGQSADSYLDAPIETILVVLFGLIACYGAALLLVPYSQRLPKPLLAPSEDTNFLLWLGLGAVVLSAFGIVMRYHFSMDRIGDPSLGNETVTGQGRVLWTYFSLLAPLAVAVFTARRMLISSRKQALDIFVIATIAMCWLAGLWGNSRSSMFAGLVSYYVTYLVYGGHIKVRHVFSIIVAAILIHVVIFPLIDLQRGLPERMTPSEYVSETLHLAKEVVTGDYLYNGRADTLYRMYESWSTRLYYGTPTGLLDRFSPSQIDEVVSYVQVKGTLGWEYLGNTVMRLVPPIVLKQLDLVPLLTGSELIQSEIWPHKPFWYPNYGNMIEMYFYVGLWIYPLAFCVYMFMLMMLIRVFYGGLKDTYFTPFYFANNLFQIADGGIGDTLFEFVIQAPLYGVLYFVAKTLWQHRSHNLGNGSVSCITNLKNIREL